MTASPDSIATDKLDTHYRQQLSALMDGGLAADEARFLMRRLQHDRELTGFLARQSRTQTTAVAGYDCTFTPVKSFSTLWALAPLPVAQGWRRHRRHG